jgi:hypothetical protein
MMKTGAPLIGGPAPSILVPLAFALKNKGH